MHVTLWHCSRCQRDAGGVRTGEARARRRSYYGRGPRVQLRIVTTGNATVNYNLII